MGGTGFVGAVKKWIARQCRGAVAETGRARSRLAVLAARAAVFAEALAWALVRHSHAFNLDFFLDQLFNVGHQACVAGAHQSHGQATGTRAARATNAVDVVFGVKGHVEVEHGGHVFDIEAARGYVGTHQQIDLTSLERFQRFQAFVLAFVAVQGGGAQAIALQRAGQACATELAVDEHKGLANTALTHDVANDAALVVIVGAVKALLHGRGGFVRTGDLDGHGVLQVAARQALDFWREGGRKQQCGAVLGQVAQDALQIGQKADVEHAVGLVEHHVFHLVEHRIFGLDVIEQTPRRGHQHLYAFFQFGGLGLHVHAAKNDGTAQLGVFGVLGDLLRHLVGQLARGQQHQGTHRVACRRGGGVFVFQQALQQGQRKGSRFAGAGLCRAHHVLACEDDGNGLCLDGRHGLVAHVGYGAQQRLRQRCG